jgi:hypothetical protein
LLVSGNSGCIKNPFYLLKKITKFAECSLLRFGVGLLSNGLSLEGLFPASYW